MKILVLPPFRWEMESGPGMPVLGPGSPRTSDRLDEEIIGPHAWPLNPLAGRHPLLEGLDPLRALQVILTRRRCDAVLVVFEAPAVFLLLLRKIFRFKPPIVMLDIGLGTWPLRNRIQDYVVPRLDGIVVLGRNQVEHVRQKWPAAKIIRFLYHRVDTQFFKPEPFQAEGTLPSVGDDPERDFVTLLRAVRGLDLPVVVKTRRIFDTPENVRVIRGRLPYPEYRALFSSARIVVIPLHPSVHAGGISILLEAMATGRPIVVTRSPGLSDYVVPEETALVVPPSDPDAMRQAIIRLMKDSDLCRRLATNALNFVQKNCTHAINGDGLAAILAEVAACQTAQKPNANRANDRAARGN
jgi:glycosyltransferase involved in cell wall biosynthesis